MAHRWFETGRPQRRPPPACPCSFSMKTYPLSLICMRRGIQMMIFIDGIGSIQLGNQQHLPALCEYFMGPRGAVLSYKEKAIGRARWAYKGVQRWVRRALETLAFRSSSSMGKHFLRRRDLAKYKTIVRCRPFNTSTGHATPSSDSSR